MPLKFTLAAMVTKIWKFCHKISYNLACTGDMCKILAPNGVFEVVLFNGVIKIYARPTHVAIVTNI